MCIPSFVLIGCFVSECLVFFLQELHCLLHVIIVVCSLKSMCAPSFVLIACFVSELYVPFVMYESVFIFTELFTCKYLSPSVFARYLLVSEIVKSMP